MTFYYRMQQTLLQWQFIKEYGRYYYEMQQLFHCKKVYYRNFRISITKCRSCYNPLEIECTLNVCKTFRRHPVCLVFWTSYVRLNHVLCPGRKCDVYYKIRRYRLCYVLLIFVLVFALMIVNLCLLNVKCCISVVKHSNNLNIKSLWRK